MSLHKGAAAVVEAAVAAVVVEAVVAKKAKVEVVAMMMTHLIQNL